MGTPVYPAAKKTYTDEVDKEDLAAAAVVNSMQDEVQAIQEELGTDPAGSLTDLKTRLAISIADDGAMKNGTSFPGSPSNGDFFYKSDEDVGYIYNGTTWKAFSAALQSGTSFPTGSDLYNGFLFYRTDENVLYVYNGTSWDAQGQSLSNVAFEISTGYVEGAASTGMVSGVAIASASQTDFNNDDGWIGVVGGSLATVMTGKFKKIAGFSTVTCYAQVADSSGSGTPTIKVDIGGQNQTDNLTQGADWAWVTTTGIDVSGLSDGTIYDVTVQLKPGVNGANDVVGINHIIGFVS